MKKLFLITTVGLLTINLSHSQNEYSGKIEAGFLKFGSTTVNVDPGPDWQGYNLNEQQNGLDLNFINGIKFGNRFYAGVGVGYLNFEGIHGLSVFSDFEYFFANSRLAPFINLRIGYNHIYNQYENGNGSGLGELGLGLSYRISDRYSLYWKSGILVSQQSLLFPVRMGFRF